ncbi:MAG: class I SAM-dependent methyltransferase [Planctomycetota bacterium]
MIGLLEDWQTLEEDGALGDALAALPEEPGPSDVEALRRRWSAEVAACVLELAKARRRATEKWPAKIARGIWADAAGVEMASSLQAAQHKARRFEGHEDVVDLCCGIGGDAIALSEVASTVIGVDESPVRAWMAAKNAGCLAMCAEVEGTGDPGESFVAHIDPARRDVDGRRHVRYEDIRPGPAVIEKLVGSRPGVAVKLPPGIDPNEVPAGEMEWLSEGGRLTQAVLWSGSLAGDVTRRATLLGDDVTTTLTGDGSTALARADRLGSWLYAVDSSVERAVLLGDLAESLSVGGFDRGAGLLTSDERVEHPMLTAFEVMERIPWSRKRVKAWLDERGCGIVEIKSRGRVIEADEEQRALRGAGGKRFTVFVQRLEGRESPIEAIVCRRTAAAVRD